MHKWIGISKPEDIDQLESCVLSEFSPAEVVPLLRSELSSRVKGILVEYPYVDKDYRSTYYGFYAKKGLRYNPFCTRLHFFGEGVSLADDLDLRWEQGDLKDQYFGYMVLRPTGITPIGRTVLSVAAKDSFSGALIDAEHVVHVLGHRIIVQGFPYMQQHTDISVCAHAACWGILRHFSKRHGRYAEFLVHDITKMAANTDPGGLVPSRGLAMDQACKVFATAGLYPDIYSLDDFKENFYRLLLAYVESGFPVFAALESKRHAITVIGHSEPERSALLPGQGLQYSSDVINSIVVIDDNVMPYKLIDGLNSDPYRIPDINGFIVPLPEKIFFPAEAVEQRVKDIIENGTFGQLNFAYIKDPVMRYFITTSASLKRYVQSNKTQFPRDFYIALVELVFPQFVWVVEISSLTDWQNKRVNALMLLDATASANDALPFFVLHDDKMAFVYDRGVKREMGWIKFADHTLNILAEFRNNLTYKY